MGVLKLDENINYSVEEYFALLEKSESKLEYSKGTITMRAGAKFNHNRIKDDTSGYIWSRLDGCRPFSSDQAVACPKEKSYYFPDLVFCCEENDHSENDNELILLNPSVIIEVLSQSTAAKDRDEKFHAYWQIESLSEYILIDSRRLKVDVFHRKGDATWDMRSYFRIDQVVVLETLNVEIPMSIIYGRVVFKENS